ncbi:MAG: hypothetical protein R3B99_26605 [Polyangiales bacterium]|nr:hypothetical protein [Sandaracinus sp.]
MTDPFAPVAPAPSRTEPCPSCGRPFDPSRGQYAPDGRIVCAFCTAAPELSTLAQTSHKNHRSKFVGALSSVGIGLLSFCIQARFFFWLFPLLAMVSGTLIFVSCVRDEEAKRALGGLLVPTMVAAAIGALIGLASLSLSILIRLALT